MTKMVMLRSQNESQVKVPFVVASMETFARVGRTNNLKTISNITKN
jgi:hypothetical protein